MIPAGMGDGEMLGLAVELEEQALRRILEMAGTLQDPPCAELLQLVAADRAGQRDCVKEEWLRMGRPSLADADVTRWLFREHRVVADPCRETQLARVLLRLTEIEVDLRAFYQAMAARTRRVELLSLYRALADSDGVHARDLSAA